MGAVGAAGAAIGVTGGAAIGVAGGAAVGVGAVADGVIAVAVG